MYIGISAAHQYSFKSLSGYSGAAVCCLRASQRHQALVPRLPEPDEERGVSSAPGESSGSAAPRNHQS